MDIIVSLAGIPLTLRSAYDGYYPIYLPFRTDAKPVGIVSAPPGCHVPEWAGESENPVDRAAYFEHMCICIGASDILLRYQRVIFHGTAFFCDGKVWIITAPPGTGKTTLYVLLKRRFPDDIRILCGDKPILMLREDGTVSVHGSPWNGKENIGQNLSGPLGGVLILEQGKENRAERVTREAVYPLFRQFLYSAETEEQVGTVCRIENAILKTVPVWRFVGHGDDASAELCRKTIREATE